MRLRRMARRGRSDRPCRRTILARDDRCRLRLSGARVRGAGMGGLKLSRLSMALGLVAAALLLFLVVPSLREATSGLTNLMTWAFWIVSIILVVALYMERDRDPQPV